MSEFESVNDKWLGLVARLFFNTKSKSLSWGSGPSENCVITSVGQYVVSIFEYGGDDEFNSPTHYLVEISDEFGSTIDKFRDDELSGNIADLYPRGALSVLFRDAKRNISGADKALDELLAALPLPKQKKGNADMDDEIPF